MSDNTFTLEVFSPSREFFKGTVEAVTVTALYDDQKHKTVEENDGEYIFDFSKVHFDSIEFPSQEITVLAHHQPMVAALVPGEFRFKANGEWRSAYNAEGFLVVQSDNEVSIFATRCEWPEFIDEAKARSVIAYETEQLRNASSLSEHRRSEIELQRMFTMLKVKSKNLNN